MQTNNSVPERDNTSDIDYEATLFVCGYTVSEAKMTDYVVVHCRICGAPILRKMSEIKYHSDIQRRPCEDCRSAFAAFRWIMWGGRVQERKNAAMRKWRDANVDEMRAYYMHRNYALEGTMLDMNMYKKRYYYATSGRGSV